MKGLYYILDEDKEIISTTDYMEWARFFEYTPNRRVNNTDISDSTTVSTVFLGIDHNFSNSYGGKPLLFETMVFSSNPDLEGYQERYSTWEEAEEGHNRIVELINSRQLLRDGRKIRTLNFKTNE